MVDKKYGLEPIEEKDLDLASRFGTDTSRDHLRPRRDDGNSAPERPHASERAQEHVTAEKESARTYEKILSGVRTTTSDINVSEETIAYDASQMHQQVNRESQIQQLLDLARTKGVIYAVKVAEHAEDYYLLDQVHDRLLANDLHDALADRKMIT